MTNQNHATCGVANCKLGFGRCSDPAIINLITKDIIQKKVSTKYYYYGVCMCSKVNMAVVVAWSIKEVLASLSPVNHMVFFVMILP